MQSKVGISYVPSEVTKKAKRNLYRHSHEPRHDGALNPNSVTALNLNGRLQVEPAGDICGAICHVHSFQGLQSISSYLKLSIMIKYSTQFNKRWGYETVTDPLVLPTVIKFSNVHD